MHLTTIEDVLDAFSHASSDKSDIHSQVSFSWDTEEQETGMWVLVMNALEQTETLVVIGYSFPFFNRGKDREILGAMKNLESIIVQDGTSEAMTSIVERLQQRLPDGIAFENDEVNTIEEAKTISLRKYHSYGDFFIPNDFSGDI
ncbi:MAG: hypothetical protein EOP04_18410 [Proteobacteria bacterium]|nr:MAG: hypothetical protein EOP04_18410 [Pseudomonadota bacterium]